MVDFRLPCGGGLDILIDPAPDHRGLRSVVMALATGAKRGWRCPSLRLCQNAALSPRCACCFWVKGRNWPRWRVSQRLLGLPSATCAERDALSLGQRPDHLLADRWTADRPAVPRSRMGSAQFSIGPCHARVLHRRAGRRLRRALRGTRRWRRWIMPASRWHGSPAPSARSVTAASLRALALTVLAGIAGAYELRHPHHGQ